MDMLAPNLRKIYENSHADALLIEQDFLRRYLTGFYSTDGYVVLTAEKCVLVVDSRYIEAAQKAKLADCVEVVEGSYSAALELVKGHKNLGVPYPFINLARAEELKKEGFSLSDCMDALKNAMLIKTERELKQIARACEIAEDAFLRLLPQIKERMCEREVAALLEYEMRALGAEGVSFDTIAAFGANGSVPHHETGETRLRFGDAVLIDFGCKTEGYCSDCTRTFLFGDDKKHEKFKEIYAHVLAAHERVIERVAAGMTGQEADAIQRVSERTRAGQVLHPFLRARDRLANTRIPRFIAPSGRRFARRHGFFRRTGRLYRGGDRRKNRRQFVYERRKSSFFHEKNTEKSNYFVNRGDQEHGTDYGRRHQKRFDV